MHPTPSISGLRLQRVNVDMIQIHYTLDITIGYCVTFCNHIKDALASTNYGEGSFRNFSLSLSIFGTFSYQGVYKAPYSKYHCVPATYLLCWSHTAIRPGYLPSGPVKYTLPLSLSQPPLWYTGLPDTHTALY